MHRQSAYLIGRDRKVSDVCVHGNHKCIYYYVMLLNCTNIYILQVVDMPIDHPSCSKQHAALQYRLVQVENEEGKNIKVVK